MQGAIVTGCPETFQSFQESQEWQQQGREQQQQGQQGQGQQQEQGQQGQQFRGDQHQKVDEVEEGDVYAIPTGVTHFIYNNGNRRLVVVSTVDIGNEANQLDFQPRVSRLTYHLL